MRDGSVAKKIKPATQTALKNAFKGTHGKLEAYSFLNPDGYFIQTLQTDNKSAFPYIETKALWIGELRKKYGETFTNTYEDNTYNFMYNSNALGLKMKKDEFFEDVQKRISKQEARLYPECNTQECVKMDDLKMRGPRGEPYRTLNKNQRDLDTIRERLMTEKVSTKVYTSVERESLIDIAQKLEKENTSIRKSVNIVEETEASLFGISGVDKNDTFFGYEYSKESFEFKSKFFERYVEVCVGIFNSTCSVSVFWGDDNMYQIVGFDTINNAWSIMYRRINKFKRQIFLLKFASKADLLHIYSRVLDEEDPTNN